MTGTTRSSADLDHRQRRLLFRAHHRGIREMDLVMGGFADAEIDRLDEAELAEFERLMELSDTDLIKWVIGEVATPAEIDTPLFRRMAAYEPNFAAVERDESIPR